MVSLSKSIAPIRSEYGAEFRRGVLAMAPVWAGAFPFGAAVAVAARAAGFSPVETQMLSMLVFAGSAQVAAISLFAGGAGLGAIALTVLALNLRHVLYGLSLDRHLPARSRPSRPWLALVMTDESYGVAMGDRHGRRPDTYYLGAALSLYVVYALAAASGVMLGGYLPESERIGLDVVFTLLFVCLLVPLLATRRRLLVAGLAGTVSLALTFVAGPGISVFIATTMAAAAGAWLDGRR
jgi:4-azaleucine resistance transporter AzlC